MKTITITLYEFPELNADAKAIALEKYRDINVDFPWYDYMLNEKKTELAASGFLDADISFSGFYSQGDGANFTATVDVAAWCKATRYNFDTPSTSLKRAIKNGEVTARITKSGRYEHSYSMDITLDGGDELAAECSRLETAILEDARKRADAIYKELKDEYDHRTSDESVADTLTINEYTFEVNGEMRNA